MEYEPQIIEPDLEPRYSRQLYLSSRNASQIRDTTQMSNMSFKLNEAIICPQGFDFYVSLVSAEIPNTIYTIDDTNNEVVATFRNISTNVTQTYTFKITNGNYSGEAGLNRLASQIGGSLSFTADGTIINLSLSWDRTRSKFFVNFTNQVGLNSYRLSFQKPLGTRPNFLGIGNGPALSISSYLYDYPRLYPNYLLLATNLSTDNQAVNVSKQAILDKIPVDVPANSYIFYKNWLLYRSKISNRHIDTINVSLLDDVGNQVNLNGAHWSFTLQIDIKQIKNMPLC